MKSRVYLRADAGPEIGLGHLSRCLSLAGYIQDSFDVRFILKPVSAEILRTISPETSDSTVLLLDPAKDEAEQISWWCKAGEIVVLDGYPFDSQYVMKLKSTGAIIVFVDDLVTKNLDADVIINHCGGLSSTEFEANFLTVFCLGPDYVLLRSAFYQRPESEKIYDVLVGFGGADPANFTSRALAQLPVNLKVAVLVGPAYEHLPELEPQVKSRPDTTLLKSLNAESLAKLMAECRNAILSASVMSYEFLTASTGGLYLIQIADNQSRMFRFLTTSGFARSFEGSLDRNFKSKQLVDGNSARRIRNVFESVVLERQAKIRRVIIEDKWKIFEWANDPDVRKQSYHTEPIGREVHERWFKTIVNAESTCFYIIEHRGISVGQIRFTMNDQKALINYMVDPDHRGKGWGDRLLRIGMRQLLVDRPDTRTVMGFVKQANHASFNSFIKCNFTETPTKEYPESVLFTLVIKDENR